MLGLLEEEFPEVCRIVTSIYPSAEDDVITSPYNSVLAMSALTEHADCVLPVENQVCTFCRLCFFPSLCLHLCSLCRSVIMIFCSPSSLLQSLVDIVNKIKRMSHCGKLGSVIKTDSTIISGQGGSSGSEKPFDSMNNIVANLLLNITR